MTKRDLVMRIADETGLTQQQVFGVLQRTLDYIVECLVRGETVEFRDFGVFDVKTRKARVGRNPRRPKIPMSIPPRRIVRFKAGKKMKLEVMKSVAPETT